MGLHEDRLFPADPQQRAIARSLYETVRDLPIISPHGHTDPAWFADNAPFGNPTDFIIKPDHYLFRMLYSQGIPMERLGLGDGPDTERDPRKAWQVFAENFHLFRGTPTAIWLAWVFEEVFGIHEPLNADSGPAFYGRIDEALQQDALRPRALFDRFGIEALATTEGALDDLRHHRKIADSDWHGRVITTYRPDQVIDPDSDCFVDSLAEFGRITDCDISTFDGYLEAHRRRRAYFREVGGATATDHGHPTARTANLSDEDKSALYQTIRDGAGDAQAHETFRAQMLTEMALMSCEDGMVMQIHPGAHRNHNREVLARFGRDKGADIPTATHYVDALQPLLCRVGNRPDLTIIAFTLDETSYSRELAPLAGHYPALKLGPPWWFHDSPEGMRRFREQATETAGFYNTVGFNDDTRAFLSIPARHDVARRMDCVWLAQLVAEHRLGMDEASELAPALAYGLAKAAYRL